MADYIELIHDLRTVARRAGNMIFLRDTCLKAADAIEELSKRIELEYQSGFADGQRAANRKRTRWISVKDRLPEGNDEVLTLDAGGKIEVAWYAHDAWNHYYYHPGKITTHWMPLPEPPEEVQE